MANPNSTSPRGAFSSRDAQTPRRPSQAPGPARARRAWSERQLDAYLTARDTLRCLRAMAWLATDTAGDTRPPASPAGSPTSH